MTAKGAAWLLQREREPALAKVLRRRGGEPLVPSRPPPHTPGAAVSSTCRNMVYSVVLLDSHQYLCESRCGLCVLFTQVSKVHSV